MERALSIDEERIRRITGEVEAALARGIRPDPEAYYLRHPDIEDDLRRQFRRIGLLEDPFRDAGQFLRGPRPWEGPGGGAANGSDVLPSLGPGRNAPESPLERNLLLENLVRPVVGSSGGMRRRWGLAILLGLAFLAGWSSLVVIEGIASRARRVPAVEIEGLAAIVALAVEVPAARLDLLRDGADEADRALRSGEDRWEARWLRFLFLQGMGREAEAARDLEALPPPVARRLLSLDGPERTEEGSEAASLSALSALGEVMVGRPDRAREALSGIPRGDGLLLEIARAAADPARRPAAARRLLSAQDPRLVLLGAVWGIAAGEPGAREVLRASPVESLSTARTLVELGEEEAFLVRARPGRIDLAPLRVRVLARRGRRDEARRLAESLLAANPDGFELRLALAGLLREANEPDAAASHLRMASILLPGSQEPMREWLRILGDHPDRPELIEQCADLFLRRASAAARNAAREAVARASGHPIEGEGLLPAAGFGLPLEEDGRARAIAGLERAAVRKPGTALLFLLGRARFAEGRWTAAGEAFEAAAKTADPLDRPAIDVWLSASRRRASGMPALPREAAPDDAGMGLAAKGGVQRPAPSERTAGRELDADGASGRARDAEARDSAPGPAGARAREALALLASGDPDHACQALEPPADDERAGVEEALVLAFAELARDDLPAARARLDLAIRLEPADPRGAFLRGYLLHMAGAGDVEADWDEVLRLAGGAGPAAVDGSALEPEALPWMLAIVHATRGEDVLARWFAPLGPSTARTPAGSFLRAAALAAAGDLPAAEAEALAYRARGWPLWAWQARDPWAGSMFR